MKLSNISNILVSKIRAERIALKLNQEEFAKFVDISYPTYKNFEQKGKISFDNFIKLLIKLKKEVQFIEFLETFEFNEQKQRVNKKEAPKDFYLEPIIESKQKQIILDKEIFGEELFYSVENGHIYDVSNFIYIVLNKWDEKRLMLLIKYFGEDRLKPYILKQKDIRLLKSFNKHINFIAKRK